MNITAYVEHFTEGMDLVQLRDLLNHNDTALDAMDARLGVLMNQINIEGVNNDIASEVTQLMRDQDLLMQLQDEFLRLLGSVVDVLGDMAATAQVQVAQITAQGREN
jgi:hypothetical protein